MSKERLDSWKSIADYLERSPRTVQRWHAYHGLPVHRFGGSKGSVFAYAEEIDRWLTSLTQEARTPEGSEQVARSARQRISEELTARASEMWEARSEDSLHAIAGLYRKSIDQDPGSVAALTGLANVMISAALHGAMDCAIAYPSAMEALRRAAQLNPADAEARCGAAWINVAHERKWRQARTAFEEALARQPQSGIALSGMALLHIAQNDVAGAAELAWNAWRQNTLVCFQGALVCWCHYLQRDAEAALETAAQVRMAGGYGSILAVVELLASIQSGRAELKHMADIARSFPQNATIQGVLAYAYAAAGQTAAAWAIRESMEQMSAQKKRSNAYGMALACLGLHSDQEAVQWLETAFAQGSLWSLGLQADPLLQRLRGNPRFQALLRKFAPPPGNVTRMGGIGALVHAS